MKKKIVLLLGILVLSAFTLMGCGSEKKAEAEVPVAEENGEEVITQIANPWSDTTEEEAKTLCPRLFKAPEGATNVKWTKCEPDASVEGDSYMVQLDFDLDGLSFTARAKYGTPEYSDISGLYYTWTVGPEDSTLQNWGGGNMEGKAYRLVNDDGYIDLITWYDIEIGISYSLTVSDKDLDGFDIQAVAEEMYNPDNESNVGE